MRENLKCSTSCAIAGYSIEEGEVLSRDDLEELAKRAGIFDNNHFVSTIKPAASSLLKIETGDGRWYGVKARLTRRRDEVAADFYREKNARERALDGLNRVERLGQIRFSSGQNVDWLIEEFARYKRDVKGLPHAPTFRRYLVDKGFDERIEVEDEAPGPSDHGDGSSSKVLNLSAPAATIRGNILETLFEAAKSESGKGEGRAGGIRLQSVGP